MGAWTSASLSLICKHTHANWPKRKREREMIWVVYCVCVDSILQLGHVTLLFVFVSHCCPFVQISLIYRIPPTYDASPLGNWESQRSFSKSRDPTPEVIINIVIRPIAVWNSEFFKNVFFFIARHRIEEDCELRDGAESSIGSILWWFQTKRRNEILLIRE